MAAVTAITGVAGLLFIGAVGEQGANLGAKLAPLGDAAMEIKLTSTHAHLKLEEILSGQSQDSIDTVWAELAETEWYAKAMVEGGENEEGKFIPSENPAVVVKIREVQKKLAAFREYAQQRYDLLAGTSSTGSAVDQAFDEQYEVLQGGIDDLLALRDENVEPDTAIAVATAKYYLADAHLFLEEMLSGDESVTPEAVAAQFEKGAKLLDQGETNWARAKAAGLAKKARDLKVLAMTRHANTVALHEKEVGIDKGFHDTFESFTRSADEAEELVHDRMDAALLSVESNIGSSKATMGIIVLIALGIAVLLTRTVARLVANPVLACTQAAKRIASGNLNVRVGIDQGDEIGDLSTALDEMTDQLNSLLSKLKEYAKQLGGDARELASASGELGGSSNQLNANAESASEATGSVTHTIREIADQAERSKDDMTAMAAAAEQMSANMTEITRVMEGAAGNLEQVSASSESSNAALESVSGAMNRNVSGLREVASSVEEMRAMLKDALGQCHVTAEASEGSAQQAKAFSGVLASLKQSSQSIGAVVGIINDIADQTNMLALNASIEAAGAGEAGKGFAVVANEVKALAAQTAEATQTISQNIDEIQANSARAVGASDKIRAGIQEIHENNQEILHAIESQYATLERSTTAINSIADESRTVEEHLQGVSQQIIHSNHSLSEVSGGVSDVNIKVTEISHAVEEVTRSVAAASKGSAAISDGVGSVASATDGLEQVVSQVKGAAHALTQISQSVNSRSGNMAKIGQELNEALSGFKLR
ncbi:methyl-accepting chemotaxis protein [Magnetofaba australis]|nr:methyl-accepting chemotaxis protein [Magnetofaba australis]